MFADVPDLSHEDDAHDVRRQDQVFFVVKRPGAAFPDRIVNNVYFDTPDLAAFEANLWGAPERRKCRLRWYGETFQP